MFIVSKLAPTIPDIHRLKWLIICCFLFFFLAGASEASEQDNYQSDTSYESNIDYSSEINYQDDPNSPIVKNDFDWQILMDLSVGYDQVLLDSVEQTELLHYFKPALLIDISYKGFFLQTNQRRSAALLLGAEFGYQLFVKENWQVDIIAKAYMPGYDPADLIEYQDADEKLFSGLEERDATLGVALRYSRYFDDSIFTIDIARAYADDDANGLIVDSFYSYLLLYRNWDIYLGAGLTYYDQALVDYYIGITPDEVTENRSLYTADSGFRAQLEVYAQYPLSASWSFNAGITQSFYNNEIKKSPLVDKNKLTQVMLGVLYVF